MFIKTFLLVLLAMSQQASSGPPFFKRLVEPDLTYFQIYPLCINVDLHTDQPASWTIPTLMANIASGQNMTLLSTTTFNGFRHTSYNRGFETVA